MPPLPEALALAAAALWTLVLLLPWRPWSCRETLDAEDHDAAHRDGRPAHHDVTVLIPARNEAEHIAGTLEAALAQGPGVRVVVVDDESGDDTAAAARGVDPQRVRVVEGAPLPEGWAGKVWALAQGRREVGTPLTLLLDADISLEPGLLDALRKKMRAERARFASLMATPRLDGAWARLLMPAFVYFFKLLYPFRLSNSGFRHVAAAAGGCVLLETRLFDEIGGLRSMRGAIIDDCTLASRVKATGARTWVGLTHSVRSRRSYTRLSDVWGMVRRTAYIQLRRSAFWLGVATALMAVAFLAPLAGLLTPAARPAALAALALMAVTYVPTLRYYGLSPARALLLPLAGTLFLAMTWDSALRSWSGTHSRWKGRAYAALER